MAPTAPPPASPRRPAGPPAPLAARRRQAALWGATLTAGLALILGGFAFLTPRPPPGQPFVWRPPGGAGLTAREAAGVLAGAAAMGAAILAVQELLLRPLFGRRAPHTTDAVFFSSSIAVRAVFAAVLARHHFGPDGADAAALGDLGHRLPIVALFIAAYASDLVQMLARPSEFGNNYTSMVVPHHVITLAWFGAWLAVAAPRSAAGAPVWNTAVFYLTCCVPIHAFKLATAFHKPRWAPLMLLPVLCLHWALLLGSQAYYFAQCSCSALGCWNLGSVLLMLGGWGMVIYTLDTRFNSIVQGGSRVLGAPISFYDIPALLAGRDPAASAPAPRAPEAASEAAAGASSEADDAPQVTAEIVLPTAKAAAAGGKGWGLRRRGGGGQKLRLRDRWAPACVAAFEELWEEELEASGSWKLLASAAAASAAAPAAAQAAN
ncbi:hypothetical protein Rsub_04953 [Raphidocelis subcapitata]|uniref:Uncharacterized protein n=1 Tax=Raphidocelis subcapitata TaxID=307507 RepID=A0A2V0NW26_9CHLO|nr:hypothetical protein Rsub_04953 [Raphidocelis subcapitata]|eukprot:GBF91848.1 hypothetical protein Rsub_04953 [Raphidocelis subcapitata]